LSGEKRGEEFGRIQAEPVLFAVKGGLTSKRGKRTHSRRKRTKNHASKGKDEGRKREKGVPEKSRERTNGDSCMSKSTAIGRKGQMHRKRAR